MKWMWTMLVGAVSLAAVPEADLVRAREEGRLCANALAVPAEAAFVSCLTSYVRLPTINPPGSEELGVEFLEAVFEGLGIPTKRLSAPGKTAGAPNRASLVATLSPLGTPYSWTGRRLPLPSIILLNHIDVVDVFPSQWVSPDLTFSGKVAPFPGKSPNELYLWGRGALDMKGIAMLQLLAMAKLKREGTPLKKEIHFLAVADEEQGAAGAIGAVREIRSGGELEALKGAEALLGEGGFGARDVIGAGTVLHAIGSEEKGGAWLSVAHPDLSGLLTALAKYNVAPRATDHRVRAAKAWGCEVTGVVTPKMKANVVPSRVELELTCRKPPAADAVRGAFAEGEVTADVKVEGNRAKVVVETPSSSHGSLGLSLSALEATAKGLQRLHVLQLKRYPKPPFFRYYQTEATKSLIDTIGQNHKMKYVPHFTHLTKWISWWNFLEQKALGYLGGQLSTERLFRTSCTWTGLSMDANGPLALLDCRLMHPAAMGLVPGQKEGTQFARLLGKYAGDPKLTFSVIEEWDYSASPPKNRTMEIITRELRKLSPTGVTAFLFPGGTDNHLFRNASRLTRDLAGVPSYGFFPLAGTVELIGTQHGSNERYPLDQVTPGINTYFGVVRGLVAE